MRVGGRRARRLREAFASIPVGASPPPNCLSSERIWAAARGDLAPEVFREAATHAIACPSCAEAWRLAREIASAAGETRRRLASSGWWTVATVAATIAGLALVLELRDVKTPPPGDPSYRAIAGEAVRSLVAPNATLPRNRFLLRWTGPEGATFDLRLATEDLRILTAATGLSVAEYRVPEEALVALPSGTPIVWQVEAVRPDGTREISRSFVNRVE